ncbi:MAG TPA: CDP-diacylglycerol diphosphatase [Stellaceae bacterium]|nr:CDP-diacylglycerol diphosphatase [Stellaceae bacterium]
MRWLVIGALSVALVVSAARADADPLALWRIVHDECVPNQIDRHDPSPCALVDLAGSYVVLKDRVGATQFLVLPTARITGIESAALLSPRVPDYMQDAWAARRFVQAQASGPLTRADLSLAVNSIFGRSQNQLHIHVDCLRADVRDTLARHRAAIGDTWQPFPVALAGHDYIARRLVIPDLEGVNPFRTLADQVPEARANMGAYTLVVAGATFAGKPGFIVLADRADPARGDFAKGESLQDHACAVAHATR